ncbi:MAG TPA: hypothetical protein VF794_11070 [Archangium sp.]|jgi:hypothetical protein|uniref:hypothetical protein n=1 Tax=Archangium sp. TaxID=1872627 RepID=UPI002EDB9654
MRKFLFSVAVLALSAVGCASPEAVCEAGVDQVCERQFECQSAAAKESEGFKSAFGTSVEDCKTRLYTANNCAARKEDNDNCTGSNAGKTFDLGAASDCSKARAKLACADYLAQFQDPTKSPAVCAQVCK